MYVTGYIPVSEVNTTACYAGRIYTHELDGDKQYVMCRLHLLICLRKIRKIKKLIQFQ